ncbi:Serine/threonine-protein kinase PknA [Tsuneonella dongtanensis]|uniref:Serine/threonine-protein kinase PknA n=1 Tax=Tsuneonella dongtanensis TaxID=692370 RepID=A0A1B2ABB7_9SPHN|nr:serine/threonine-protein kinase [Tsuneonella dongtanensis]ANY19391.1 Serine/threonine-protein kinase PknA [Tsuneonella dongtanensis]
MSDDDKKDDDRTVFQPPPGNEGGSDPFGLPRDGAGPSAPPPEQAPYSAPANPVPPFPGSVSEGPPAPAGGGFPPVPPAQSPDPFAPITPPPQPAMPSAPAGQIAVGDVLSGIYRITRFIARGGMGEVYEGVNIHSAGERVAIKVILSNLASDELVMAMFAKEAATLTRLHHEAIVPYRLAARDAYGRPFIVTEYVDGPSLEERLGQLRLTDDQFGALTRRLARGLGAAHWLGAIHRDIAPDNILLVDGDPEQPKIIDFGIARDAREQTKTIVGDGFAGKLKYVAPEQLGEYGRNIGPWTDLYSLALTLLAVASGRHTDMGGSIADAVRKRMSVPDLSAIPARYRQAFERALQPDPALRPQTMSDFIALLHEAEGREGTGFLPIEDRPRTQRPTAIPEKQNAARLSPLSRLPGGKWAAIGAIGALVLLLGVVGIVLATSSEEDEPLRRADQSGQDDGASSGSLEPGSQAFAVLAASLAQSPPCSWLTFDGADSTTARFVGGAGNPAAAQSTILDGLAGKGAGNVSLDMADAIGFEPALCGAIDAFREFRAPEDLVSSPQRSYEAEQQAIPLTSGGSLGPGMYAKPLIRVNGLRAGEEVVLLQIMNGKISPLFASRSEGEEIVGLLAGTATADGFEMPFPAEFDGPTRESYGIAVIVGQGPFPPALFGNPNLDEATPIDSSWPDRFRSEARTRGWRTDIFWFSVTDETPG